MAITYFNFTIIEDNQVSPGTIIIDALKNASQQAVLIINCIVINHIGNFANLISVIITGIGLNYISGLIRGIAIIINKVSDDKSSFIINIIDLEGINVKDFIRFWLMNCYSILFEDYLNAISNTTNHNFWELFQA